jgi:hypothetical protein
MKLVDLDPRWAVDADIVIGGVARHYENRHGMAVSFECPCCFDPAVGHARTRLAVWFENPIDGGPKTDDADKWWTRSGESFDTLTLSPSINAEAHGHWHGSISNGQL